MRLHRLLGTLLGMMLALALSLAHASPAYHRVDKVVKTATGWQVHVLMMSAPGYNNYSVGITVGGGRSSLQQHAQQGSANGTGVAILNLPSGQYRSGQTVRVISSWRGQGRIHYWGQDSGSLASLP